MRIPALFIGMLAFALAGCGTPGAPLPPSLGIPKPVENLQAARKGETVTLTWSAPTETTDGELFRKPGKMLVSRTVAGNVAQIAELPLQPALEDQPPPAPTAKDSLANLLQAPPADFAEYRVLAQSRSGKSDRPSNLAAVPLVPTPVTPQRVQAVAVPQGISLNWDQAWPPQNRTHLSTQYLYKIMRRAEDSKTPVVVAQPSAGNEAMAFVDTGIEWQKHYDYWITPVTLWQGTVIKGEVEGDDSPVVSVFADDKFPPAVPENLQAVFSGIAQQPFIDLTWTPDTDPDLAGYNVYRHVGEEAPVKINSELVKTPSFRDTDVKPGTKYFYTVSAVDLRANESERSKEASESVPLD
jgi:hypothetical protein